MGSFARRRSDQAPGDYLLLNAIRRQLAGDSALRVAADEGQFERSSSAILEKLQPADLSIRGQSLPGMPSRLHLRDMNSQTAAAGGGLIGENLTLADALRPPTVLEALGAIATVYTEGEQRRVSLAADVSTYILREGESVSSSDVSFKNVDLDWSDFAALVTPTYPASKVVTSNLPKIRLAVNKQLELGQWALGLAHDLAQNMMQQTTKPTALQLILADGVTVWHAGGQRFESAWLH